MEAQKENKTGCTVRHGIVRYLQCINSTFTLLIFSVDHASAAFDVVVVTAALAPVAAVVVVAVDIAYVAIFC